MSDHRASRTNTSRRRQGKLPWVDPDAPRAWWSAPVRRTRIIEHPPGRPQPGVPADAPRKPHNTPGAAVVDADPPPGRPGEAHPESPFAAALDQGWAWLREVGALRVLRSALLRVALVVIALVFVALLINLLGSLLWNNHSGSSNHGAAAHPTATRRIVPTPTVPRQTELDGVIVITNLDPQVPYEGDVQITAQNGAWYCRNAPLPRSTWHVRLEPGASISLPCIIPVATPSSLPPHTFSRVIRNADGTGLALIDNPEPFQGAVFIPTPVTTP